MNRIPGRALLAAKALLLAVPGLQAQAPAPAHEILKLSDTLYEFRTKDAGYLCKVLASIGPDGVLLVETDRQAHIPALLEELRKRGGGRPRIVINSHSHQEHWDGNVALGKEPIYIGHPNLRRTLTSGPFLFAEVPPEILPTVLVQDALTLHFNGEEVRIRAFPGAHDDSDLVVWFTRSKVAFVGALATALKIPTVDGRGGDVLLYPEVTQAVLDWLPRDVKLVPGHGEDATHDMGVQFLEMLRGTEAKVREALAQGKTLEAMKQEDLLKAWSGWETSYSTRFSWLKNLHDALTGKAQAHRARQSAFEPLHQALKDRGTAGIGPAWAALKALGGRYRTDDTTLLSIAFTLEERRQHPEALVFAELCLREFPKTPYLIHLQLLLAELHLNLGEKAKAAAFAKAVVASEPKNTRAADLLARAEAK